MRHGSPRVYPNRSSPRLPPGSGDFGKVWKILPFRAKGVGESATVGALPAIANGVVDALAHLGVRHIDIPITPEKVWKILKEKGVAVWECGRATNRRADLINFPHADNSVLNKRCPRRASRQGG